MRRGGWGGRFQLPSFELTLGASETGERRSSAGCVSGNGWDSEFTGGMGDSEQAGAVAKREVSFKS